MYIHTLIIIDMPGLQEGILDLCAAVRLNIHYGDHEASHVAGEATTNQEETSESN